MSNLSIRLTRTVIPMTVGALITFFANLGIHLSSSGVAGLTSLVAGAVSIVYYFLVTILEEKFPKAGILLGTPTKPEYIKGVSWLNSDDAPIEDPTDDNEDAPDDVLDTVHDAPPMDAPPEIPGTPLDDEDEEAAWEDEPRDENGRFTTSD